MIDLKLLNKQKFVIKSIKSAYAKNKIYEIINDKGSYLAHGKSDKKVGDEINLYDIGISKLIQQSSTG